MSSIINYRQLKEDWKQSGEIPEWYSTNALQFFMESYSYKGESVLSRDKTTCSYLAKYAPTVKPDWWEEDPYTKGKEWEEVFLNLVYYDGFAVFSTPLKANGGIPERGMPISCSGQTLSNSIASKSFIRGELEQLIKNAHGCAISLEDWLAEGTVYDADGNMSEGIVPIIKDFQKVTEEINQGIRRGQTAFYVSIEHGDFYKVADLLEDLSDKLNIGWIVRDSFTNKLVAKDPEALNRLKRVIKLRASTGKGYICKLDTMKRNRAEVFKILGLEAKGSNLCMELNLPANDEYTFSCPIINVNLSLWDEFPEHLFHLIQIMQDCNVSGYLEQIESKKGFARLFLDKIYKFTKDFRATGMGTCGFHSLLMRKGFPVGSFEAMMLNEEVFKRQQKDTREASQWLGDVFGAPDGVKRAGKTYRNTTTMFAPPTKGSVELTRNTPSEGVSMETALVKVKETVGGDIFRINYEFLQFLKRRGLYTPEIVEQIAKDKGSCQNVKEMTEEEKYLFRIAFEIPVEDHLDLCAQRQPYFDQQQSINLAFSGNDTEEYIGEIHMKALLDDNINGLYYNYGVRGGEHKRIKECLVCQ